MEKDWRLENGFYVREAPVAVGDVPLLPPGYPQIDRPACLDADDTQGDYAVPVMTITDFSLRAAFQKIYTNNIAGENYVIREPGCSLVKVPLAWGEEILPFADMAMAREMMINPRFNDNGLKLGVLQRSFARHAELARQLQIAAHYQQVMHKDDAVFGMYKSDPVYYPSSRHLFSNHRTLFQDMAHPQAWKWGEMPGREAALLSSQPFEWWHMSGMTYHAATPVTEEEKAAEDYDPEALRTVFHFEFYGPAQFPAIPPPGPAPVVKAI